MKPEPHPSGRQTELACGDQRVVVTEVGGGLRSYTAGGRAVLDGYAAGEMCNGGRGQVLIPWPNRLAQGRYHFGGVERQLPLTEPTRMNAIHGLVRWASWQVVAHPPDGAVASHVIRPQPGYPFTLAVAIEYRLTPAGLTVTTTATNAGADALPFGAGFHPYVSVSDGTVDGSTLLVPADSELGVDDQGIPSGTTPVVEGSEHDFRSARAIGATRLDTCFTSMEVDADGMTRVVLASPDRTRAVTVWMDRSFPYVMVFTGDTLSPHRRRRGLAIEPMTCAPDALRNGRGLLVLQPGQSTRCRWGIQPYSGPTAHPGARR